MIDFKSLHAGDIINFSGTIYTARDAAHLRLKGLIDDGKDLPVDFTDSYKARRCYRLNRTYYFFSHG